MPEPLWLYLMALLYFSNVTTCSALADAFDSVSHDRLTRMLQGTWSGHTLLDLALRLLFTVAGGYLSVDDTVVAKPYARLLGEAAWVWSNKDRKVLFGVSVVLLVWTEGQVRIPLAFRVWHKGGASKYDLALELLSYARNRLRCKPAFVLFDSWYPSQKLLKRIRDYGWYFVCQLKKNRRFEGRPLVRYLQQPYWQATGSLSGGIKVFVVRYRRKYYATNRLTLTAHEVRRLYRKRHEVEEVIKVLKSQLSLEACQGGYTRSWKAKASTKEGAQTHHIALCLVAYLIVERERLEQGCTWRQLKRRLILQGRQLASPALERVRAAA
jgi:energy-converting hydrogenase A subunit M